MTGDFLEEMAFMLRPEGWRAPEARVQSTVNTQLFLAGTYMPFWLVAFLSWLIGTQRKETNIIQDVFKFVPFRVS